MPCQTEMLAEALPARYSFKPLKSFNYQSNPNGIAISKITVCLGGDYTGWLDNGIELGRR